MPDISELEIGGVTYTVKDYTAREVDNTLSGTSEKPLANRVIYNMIADCAVNWRIDEETGLARLVNRFGQDIGDALDIMNSTTYKPKITNLLPSRVITVSGGSSVVLQYRYESVDDNMVDDGPGVGTIVCNNVSTATFNVPQGANTYDVTSLLSAGENSVKVRVMNSEGTTREFTYSVIVLTLSLTTDLVSPDAYYGPVSMNYVLTGYGDSKVVHFEMDGTELVSDTVSTSGRTTTKVIPEQSAGVHTLRVWAVVTQNGVTVTSNIITLNMVFSTAALPAIALETGQYAIRYFNTDGAYLYGYAAASGSAAINPAGTGDIEVPTKAGTSDTSYVFNGWSDLPAVVTKNCAVVAAYTTSYKVLFINNGITFDTQWVASGANASAPANTPTRSETSTKAYVFAGWTTDDEGATAEDDALLEVTAPRTLYAIFTELNKYTVRFMNGTTVLQTVTVIEGGTATYTGATPTTTQEGYVFAGWLPSGANISANTDCVAQFRDTNTPLSKYLARTMTEYESDSATVVAQYAFYQQTVLQTVESSAATIEQYAFNGCTALTEVDLTSTSPVTIQANAFAGCTQLTHLIIRSTTVSTLSATSALTGTKIASGNGAIYVPAELVDTYKAATNWSTYASQIYPITAYPVTDFSTITDSWDTIIGNSNYATDYKVGDTKLLDLGSKGQVYMELVAMDTDVKADSSGNARMTWLSKSIIETHNMNASSKTSGSDTGLTAGGWENTDMRAYLKSTIKPLIPEVVRNAIVEVTKISSVYTGGALVKDGQTTTDDVWIPSVHEIFNNTNCETTGAVYSTKFNSSANRIKYNASGSANNWWLRSANNASNFRYVDNNGSENDNSASSAYGLVLGFCI